jgi:hypothetical protein
MVGTLTDLTDLTVGVELIVMMFVRNEGFEESAHKSEVEKVARQDNGTAIGISKEFISADVHLNEPRYLTSQDDLQSCTVN